MLKDFKPVEVSLATPKKPQVWIVASGGFSNARQAVFEQKTPIAFDRDDYWAAVYAGSTGSSPRAIVIDRVEVGKTATEIVVYKPILGPETKDMHPYWFFIPLGRLPSGPYTVKVSLANGGSTVATFDAQLRGATKEEVATRNNANGALSSGASLHYEQTMIAQREYGAALQLQLQRLASFVDANQKLVKEPALLSEDVAQLGAAVDSNQNVYGPLRAGRHPLAPPDPGYKLDLIVPRSELDNTTATWKPSQIKLSDIWMCDGTDAGWFASSTYRNIPELNGALTAKDPTPIQLKIRKIWKALEEKSKVPRTSLPWVNAKGKINDAIDAAYQVFVEDIPPTKSFTADDEVWAVFVAKRSFLIRDVYTRTYGDEFDKSKRTEFLVRASAYIGKADSVADDACAPVTLALIPLGKNEPNGVGIYTSLLSICCRDLKQSPPSLFDAKPPKSILADLWNYMGQGAGFTISK